MATINHSSGADIIVPNNNGTTYRGLGGDDTYILSNSIAANAAITIVDTSGSNTIQLVDGLSVASTKFAADAVQLTLSNGAVVTINGASNFDFDLGGNSTAGTTGSVSSFAGFAAGAGVSTLPASGSVAGASNVSVTGTSWSGGAATYTYTVSSDASQVTEGNAVTFTVSSSSAVAADTSLTWTAIGSNNGSTVDKASAADLDAQSGSVTIPAGSSSATFSVTPIADGVAEGIEGIQVSVFSPESATVGTSTVLVNNAGASSTAQTFSGTTGVNNFSGASGDDTFSFTTTGTLNNVDVLDGAGGSDSLSVTNAGGVTITPNAENIENLSITPSSGTLTIDLKDTASVFDSIIATTDGSNNTVVNNVAEMPGKVGITNGDGDLTVNLKAGPVSGTADTINIELAGAGTDATLTITDDSTTGKINAATINSISSANTLATLALDGASSLSVTGDQSLTLTQALEATVTTVDASGMTGVVGLTMSAEPAAAAGITITGSGGVDALVATDTGKDNISAGGGNDTITFSGDNEFTVLDTVDGGAGKDTVVHTENTIVSSQLGGLSNVEVLKSSAASTVTLTSNVSPTEFNLANAGNDTISFNDDYSQASTVNLYGDAASADTITNNSNIDLTVIGLTTDFAADLTTDSPLTITGSATATDTLVIYANGNGNIDADGTASITNIDNVSFNSLVGVTGAYSAATSFDFGAYTTALTVTNNLGALDGALTTDFSGGITKGTVNYTGGAGVDIVTGSTLNDTISTGGGIDTVTSTSGVNTIDTGDGADIVNMGTGTDIISTGAGNDVIDAGASDLLANDVIDGGEGNDVLTYAANSIADESVFGGVSNVESIKPLAADNGAMALTMNGNMGPKIVDASDDSNLTLTLKAGVTDAITVKLGADVTSNDDNVVNGGAGMANTDLTVTATDPDSFDSTTGITGGTGTDTITITMVAAGTADISGSTGIDVLNVIDYTTGADIVVTAGANGSTPLTVNATTQDSGETMDFNGQNSTVGVTLNAGAGADSLDGGAGGDTINGNDGIDVIDGQANSAVTGADNISGGAGNDIINVSTTETEFSNSSTTALVTDTVDGGAGTDTLAFGAAVTLTKAELANISNIEKVTLTNASTITLSDDFLTNNPGVSLTLATGTINAGAGTTADPTITLALNYIAGNGNIKVTGGTADDTFGTASGALINVSDTIDGGAGTDTINVYNDSGFGLPSTRATGDSVTLALDIYHTNIENITVVDSADDENAGDVTVSIAAAFTGTALTIDGSSLDQNPLSANAEILTVSQNTADTAALTVTGGTGPDVFTSGAAADNLTGGAGADNFTSSAGNDSIYGGAGNDIINAGSGRDYIEAGDGNDQITVTADSDFEVSGGTETVDGGAGSDTLTFQSNAAHDISSAELGNVKNVEFIEIHADAEEKQSTIGLSDTVLSNNGGSITILGNSHAHADSDHKIDGAAVGTGTIRFIPKGDTTGKNDTFIGGAGDDTLQIGFSTATAPGGTGVAAELEATDVFTGNGGTDVIEYWNVGDNLAANPTEGQGDITAAIDFDNITGVEKIVVMDSDGPGTRGTADPITTSIAALTATTTKMPATFEYDGSIIADAADDQDFNYNDATSADNDALTTDFTITTGAGDDSVGGSGGDDTITTGSGADVVFGGGRSDTIDGGAGDDTLYGGDETALTGGGDSILGGSGADIIDGDAGADTILGGDGADIITGGTGADIMTGGSGADVFTLVGATESGGSSIDTITDFTTGSDTIRITQTGAEITATGTMAFSATDLGDVDTFAEVEAILSGKVGEAVYVKDTAQLVIDLNGDANINSNDIRVNLTGTTAYDNADVVYTIGLDTAAARTYTLSDGADIVTGTTDVIIDTINALGGNDNIASGSGADIINGGAGNDIIDGEVGVDVITGGAGNDTITLTDNELDTWTASAATATAPYVATNTGSDTVVLGGGGGEAHGQFDLDPLSSVAMASTGTSGWLAIEGDVSDVMTVNVDATAGVALAGKILAVDNADLTATASEIAGIIETTTTGSGGTDDNYLSLADNSAGVIVHGDIAGANAPVTIWWVDNALDGDGTDVTAADVHLLVTTSADLDLDTLYGAQFIV